MKKVLLFFVVVFALNFVSCEAESVDEELQLTDKCDSTNSGHIHGEDCDDDDNGEG